MTDYASMSIDDLFAWRDQWPAQRTEWNRAELALQKRLAVVDELCRLCGELDAEGWVVVPKEPTDGMLKAAEDYINEPTEWRKDEVAWSSYTAMISAAPLPASPSSVEG